jgi:hypothetical protein
LRLCFQLFINTDRFVVIQLPENAVTLIVTTPMTSMHESLMATGDLPDTSSASVPGSLQPSFTFYLAIDRSNRLMMVVQIEYWTMRSQGISFWLLDG